MPLPSFLPHRQMAAGLLATLLLSLSPVVQNKVTAQSAASTQTNIGNSREDTPPKTVTAHGIRFVLIPSGEFHMGDEKEGPVHLVVISKPFYLGIYEITQAQWKAVMGKNPSRFKGDDRPVENVSWEDAKKFIRRLNAREGREIYRLPTEAEWEYACRGGTTTEYAGNLEPMGWYRDNSKKKSQPVGKKQPNPFGLYDMHGNVWEWCSDVYGAYPNASVTDPTGSRSGWRRVYRGGSWSSNPQSCRSAERFFMSPEISKDNLGFRLARITDQ